MECFIPFPQYKSRQATQADLSAMSPTICATLSWSNQTGMPPGFIGLQRKATRLLVLPDGGKIKAL